MELYGIIMSRDCNHCNVLDISDFGRVRDMAFAISPSE